MRGANQRADENALIRAAQRGDSDAFEQLVRTYDQQVLRMAFNLLHSQEDARDVYQEVFLRVFRSLRRWYASRPLRPWVLGIAVNRCRTWAGRRAKGPELADYLHETADPRPEDDSGELARELRDYAHVATAIGRVIEAV